MATFAQTAKAKLRIAALLVLAIAGMQPVQAHEGHDHGDAPAVAIAQPLPPRLSLQSPRLEVVVTTQEQNGHGDLLIYADDYASNAPAQGLRVSLRGAGRVVQAMEQEPGLYRVDLSTLVDEQAQHVDIDLSLVGAQGEDHLQGQLPLPQHRMQPAHRLPRTRVGIAVGVIATALAVFVGMAVVLVRRRRK